MAKTQNEEYALISPREKQLIQEAEEALAAALRTGMGSMSASEREDALIKLSVSMACMATAMHAVKYPDVRRQEFYFRAATLIQNVLSGIIDADWSETTH